jgi:Rap1a immunity proteins
MPAKKIAPDDGAADSLVPEAQVRAELGGISAMTIWRWDRDPALIEIGLPPPMVVRRRVFRSRQQLEQFKRALMLRAIEDRRYQRRRSKAIAAAVVFVVALALSGMVAGGALAANRPYFDGNGLLNTCRSSNVIEQAHCYAYVLGVADTVSVWKKTTPDASPACPEPGVTGDQFREIGMKYLERKVKERHEPATILLMRAFREQWPCKKASVTE